MAERGRKVLVLDVFAENLHAQASRVGLGPQKALRRVGERVAGVAAGIAARPVRRLDVVGVGRHRLGDPLVAVGRLAGRVVEIVEQREPLHQRVGVRRGLGAEHGQRGIAVAGGHVAEHLVVGAVLADNQEHVLDQRRLADMRRDRDRGGIRVRGAGRGDVGLQVPVVVLAHLLGEGLELRGELGQRDQADGAVVLVGVVAGDAVVGLKRVARADALVVGDDELVPYRVDDYRAGREADRDHAEHRLGRRTAEVDDGDGVGVVERDVGHAGVLVDGDRGGRRAVRAVLLPRRQRRQLQVDQADDAAEIRVDHRDGVVVGVGDQQVRPEQRHPGRVQPGLDGGDDLLLGEVDDRDGAGGGEAVHRVGHDRRAGRVDLKVGLGRGASALVADIGDVAVDQDAVRRVADADLAGHHRRALGEVDGGQRVVLVEQRVRALAALGERDAARVRRARGVQLAARPAVVADRAVREALDERGVGRHRDVGVVAQQPVRIDRRDGDVAAVLAKHKILAVGRVGDAGIAAARILERQIALQHVPGAGVEHLHGCRRPHGEHRGGVAVRLRVDRDGLGADLDAEINLGAGRRDDLAGADDRGAVALRAGLVGRELRRWRGQRRRGQPHRQQTGERPQPFGSKSSAALPVVVRHDAATAAPSRMALVAMRHEPARRRRL